MEQLQKIPVPPEVLDRWQDVAGKLGEHGIGLRFELGRIGAGDNSRHMLGRAAKAARIAEDATDGQLSALAADVAAEIEDVADR